MMNRASVAVARAGAIWTRAIVEGYAARLGRTLAAVSADYRPLGSTPTMLRHTKDDRCTRSLYMVEAGALIGGRRRRKVRTQPWQRFLDILHLQCSTICGHLILQSCLFQRTSSFCTGLGIFLWRGSDMVFTRERFCSKYYNSPILLILQCPEGGRA